MHFCPCLSHLVQSVLDVVFNISTCSLPCPTASYAIAWPIEQTTIVGCQQTGFSLGVLYKMGCGVWKLGKICLRCAYWLIGHKFEEKGFVEDIITGSIADDCFEDYIKYSELYFLLPIAVEWITASYVMLCRIYVNVLYAIVPLIHSHSLLTTYQQKYWHNLILWPWDN